MFKDCCQKVNMHLCLQTSVGPVKFPDTDCYIVQEASWGILIEKSLKDYCIISSHLDGRPVVVCKR